MDPISLFRGRLDVEFMVCAGPFRSYLSLDRKDQNWRAIDVLSVVVEVFAWKFRFRVWKNGRSLIS